MALLIALVCVWLAMMVNSARRQANSVARFESLRGHVWYDAETTSKYKRALMDGSTTDLGLSRQPNPQSSWPEWLIRAAGRDLFHQVEMAYVCVDQSEVDTREIVNSLPGLKEPNRHLRRGHAKPPRREVMMWRTITSPTRERGMRDVSTLWSPEVLPQCVVCRRDASGRIGTHGARAVQTSPFPRSRVGLVDPLALVLRAWSFVILSTFRFRHSSFPQVPGVLPQCVV